MKKIISVIIFLNFCGFLQAQPPPYKEVPRKIRMPKYYQPYLPPKTFPFSAIHVIQNVWDSTTLGYLQKGMLNITTDALPAKDMTAFLQEYVTHQYKDYFKKSASQVLFVFKNLRVTEKTFFSRERAYAWIIADSYISTDGTSYKKAVSMDSVLIMQGMGDITSDHGQNIAYGILDLLTRTLDKGRSLTGNDAPGQTIDQIKQALYRMYDWPVLRTDKYKDGLFMTFEDFLQHTPSVIKFETEVIDKKTIRIVTLKEDNSKEEIKPWGICKEGELYKFHELSLVPIEKKANGFIISDYLEKSQRRNKGIAFGFLLGGLAGGGIASATAPKLFPVTAFPYLSKQQPDASVINMRTGELSF